MIDGRYSIVGHPQASSLFHARATTSVVNSDVHPRIDISHGCHILEGRMVRTQSTKRCNTIGPIMHTFRQTRFIGQYMHASQRFLSHMMAASPFTAMMLLGRSHHAQHQTTGNAEDNKF